MARRTLLDMRSGASVRVKSAAEIAATLDASGRLDGIPFMPEMVAFAGRTLNVHRQADKTCVEGGGLRRLDGALLLQGARCDGSAHDGCQRGCMMFWKPEWLTDNEAPQAAIDLADETRAREQLLTRPTVLDGHYDCQSTALLHASAPIGKLDLGHLVTDVRRGDLSLGGLAAIAARTLTNLVRRRFGLSELDLLVGDAGAKAKGALKLKPGEWVRVKPLDEIRATLGPDSKNNGLSFEPEMARYAGRVFRVEGRVERIIHEETGRMVKLAGTVSLCDLVCQGSCVKNCPRANPLYWREAWLERVENPANAEQAA